MNESTKEHLKFDIDTNRVLQILSEEIYDSPKAFLRENVQNAYDAILMRCTAKDLSLKDHKIEITIAKERITIRDEGIGMTIEDLKNNFWKAGSSGKKTELAQRSEVIGTFGIGAMANFGVCSVLQVKTRHIDSDDTLVSSAKRAELRIAQDCIVLERISDDPDIGTTIIADLEPSFSIDKTTAIKYLSEYVRFIAVPVFVNGEIISQHHFSDTFSSKAAGNKLISTRSIARGEFSAKLTTYANGAAYVIARLENILLNGHPLSGNILLSQDRMHIWGFRNLFALAPIPVSSFYNFGGFINLNILQPTAGRESLSRESIQHVAKLLAMIEAEVSKDVAKTKAADKSRYFQQYILHHKQFNLAKNVKIDVLPTRDEDVTLHEMENYEPTKTKHFYIGQDNTILQMFANERSNLYHVSHANPKRSLQIRYLKELSKIPEVPDQIRVVRILQKCLTMDEVMFLVRLRGILDEQYFMPDVNVVYAKISHRVDLEIKKVNDVLHIAINRDMEAMRVVIQIYETAKGAFYGMVTDFVREHIYPKIRNHIPSSTRQGRDALYRRLKENEELFRYDQSDFGKIESFLADYIVGNVTFEQVLRSAGRRLKEQHQQVNKDQVGRIEDVLPIVNSVSGEIKSANIDEASPPIFCSEETDKKVLTVESEYKKLHGFKMFLALSNRFIKCDGEFLREPHTTKLIWSTHRVIYIFTNTSCDLSLYYDIKLKEPLGTEETGGEMIPTTTLVMKNRIFVPVPNVLKLAFQITNGTKEFFVSFDTIIQTR